jgi:hypothetical protein
MHEVGRLHAQPAAGVFYDRDARTVITREVSVQSDGAAVLRAVLARTGCVRPALLKVDRSRVAEAIQRQLRLRSGTSQRIASQTQELRPHGFEQA